MQRVATEDTCFWSFALGFEKATTHSLFSKSRYWFNNELLLKSNALNISPLIFNDKLPEVPILDFITDKIEEAQKHLRCQWGMLQ